MHFLKRLKDDFLKGRSILEFYYNDIDKLADIDSNFYDLLSQFQNNLILIESLLKDINKSVEVYARAFKEIINTKKDVVNRKKDIVDTGKDIINKKISESVPLSKDEYKIIDLGMALKKCTAYFGNITSSPNANISVVNVKASFSEVNFMDDLVRKQDSLIILLTKAKEIMAGLLSYETYDAIALVRKNHTSYTQSIRTVALLLDTFLEENNKFLQIEEELKQNALALYQKIISNTKSIDYVENGFVQRMLCVIGIPIRELVHLKYLMILADKKEYAYLDIYPRSHITMHMDTAPFRHYNFVLGKKNSERNIHIVPKEYEREFEKFLEKHAA